MKFFSTRLLVVLLAFYNAPRLYADATVTLTSPGEADATFYTRNGLVRVNVEENGGDSEGYMVFNSHTNQLTMIDTQNRRKMDMSEKAMDQRMDAAKGYQQQMMSMMEEKLKNLPADQQRMIREQMKMTAQPPVSATPKKAEKPRIVKTGNGKYKQYDCTQYAAFRGKQKTAEACFASAKELQLSKADYDAFKAMFRHMHRLQEKTQAMAGQFGDADTGEEVDFMGDEVDGLPVMTKNLRTGEESVVTGISNNKLSDRLFALPDYPDIEMPSGMPAPK